MVGKGHHDDSRSSGSMCGMREVEKEIESISMDERSSSLHTMSTSGLLPALGAHSHRRAKLRPFIISYRDPHYSVVSPFEFAFGMKRNQVLSISDNVVNGFFAIDIVLTFFVAYLDKTTYVIIDDPKLIALRYARTWLVFDLISTIPYEFIMPSRVGWYEYLSMLRLWRLRRISAMFKR